MGPWGCCTSSGLLCIVGEDLGAGVSAGIGQGLLFDRNG